MRPWWGPGETDAARVGSSGEATIAAGPGGAGPGASGGARAAEVCEEGPHDGGVLHDGDDPQPTATAGTGEDIESEYAVHQRRRVPGLISPSSRRLAGPLRRALHSAHRSDATPHRDDATPGAVWRLLGALGLAAQPPPGWPAPNA